VNQHRHLLDALIATDARLVSLYQNSAEFHAAIETVARVLPPLVQLIADDADRETRNREAAIEYARTHPIDPTIVRRIMGDSL
jgi:hypothetical protein